LANPEFDPERKMALMRDLMAARRAVKDAKSGEQKAEAEAHRAIDAAREASASGGRTSNLKHFICCLVCAGFTTGGR
jgi:hypothetical protein